METLNGITVPTGATYLHGHLNNPVYDVGVKEGWHFEFCEWPDCYYMEGANANGSAKNQRKLVKAQQANQDDPVRHPQAVCGSSLVFFHSRPQLSDV